MTVPLRIDILNCWLAVSDGSGNSTSYYISDDKGLDNINCVLLLSLIFLLVGQVREHVKFSLTTVWAKLKC